MMKSEDPVLDANGEILREGDSVILLNAPDELLSDLPSEDQAAIKTQVGKAMPVQSFDEHGVARKITVVPFTKLFILRFS